MTKNNKLLLGLAVVGIGGFLLWKSNKPKTTAGFVATGSGCEKICLALYNACVKNNGQDCDVMKRNCVASCFTPSAK